MTQTDHFLEAFIDLKPHTELSVKANEVRDLIEGSFLNEGFKNKENPNQKSLDSADTSPGVIEKTDGDILLEFARNKAFKMEYYEERRLFLQKLFLTTKELKEISDPSRNDFLELRLFLINFELNKRRIQPSQFETKTTRSFRDGFVIGFAKNAISNMVETTH